MYIDVCNATILSKNDTPFTHAHLAKRRRKNWLNNHRKEKKELSKYTIKA